MGNIVGRIRFRMTRPLREYNLEDRAHKAITLNKAVASPRHPNTESLIEKSIKNLAPEMKDELENLNPKLESHLRSVFVTSTDVTPSRPVSTNNPERPLPLNRTPVQPAQYGYHDPKVVPYGKVRLKDVLEFLTKHMENPQLYSASHVASKYKLDEQLTGQVLKYFGMFRMVVPVERTEKQEELLKRLRASSDHLPNSPLLQRALQGVPVMGKPDVGDKEGKLPLMHIKGPEVDTSHEVSLFNYKYVDPLSKGRSQGDPYYVSEEHANSSEPNTKKSEIIEGVPVRSARRPEDAPKNEAQNAGRK